MLIFIKPTCVDVAVYITANCKPRLIPVKYNFHILLLSAKGPVIETYSTILYWSADKSLAPPWKETSYRDQYLQHYSKAYGVQTEI